MQFLNNLFRDQGGQTATEYMVLLASVVAVILAAAWKFTPLFEKGVTGMGKNVQKNLTDGFK
jgi:Flp pilus assembly pilin Flp